MHDSEPDLRELLLRLPGIGPARAARISVHHGSRLLQALQADAEAALGCPGGLPASQVSAAAGAWRALRTERELLAFLGPPGLAFLVTSLIARFADRALGYVRQHPYRLVADGASFAAADQLAHRIAGSDSAVDLNARAEAAILASLYANERAGNSVLGVTELLRRAGRLCARRVDADRLAALERRCQIVTDGQLAWTATAERTERSVARDLHRLTAHAPHPSRRSRPFPTGLTTAQTTALRRALTHGVTVCIGRAGTGKTHVIAALTDAAQHAGLDARLAAPTGRAARNLSHVTGQHATTVHRLLEWNGASHDSRGGPARNADRPLECDLVIVDEASLLDLSLFARLLDALPDGCRLALFGDSGQLPSVGPGRVLADIVESAELPVTVLPTIMRHSSRSAIAAAACAIRSGRTPRPAPSLARANGDFEIRDIPDPQLIADHVSALMCDELPTRYDVDPVTDILVLCPGKHGPAGTHALNRALGEHLNPAAARNDAGVGPGDRAIWITNDDDLALANGTLLTLEPHELAPGQDPGPLRAFADDGRPLLIPANRQSSLLPAWAVTVHRAQGLEVPIVIVAMSSTDTHPSLLNRAMLYTAVTRASKAAVICTDSHALQAAITREGGADRHTTLARKIVAHAPCPRAVAA